MMTSKLNEVGEELRHTQAKHDEMTRDYAKMADMKTAAEQEVMRLQTTLTDFDTQRSTAEETVHAAQAKVEVSQREIKGAGYQ